jgi:feruloyl esterase
MSRERAGGGETETTGPRYPEARVLRPNQKPGLLPRFKQQPVEFSLSGRWIEMRWMSPLLLAALASSPCLLQAQKCETLKDLRLPDTTITLAQSVTSGEVADIGTPLHGLPAFCRVAGVLRPTSDSAIQFEVWIPANDWNGRFLGVGNGGFAGSIGYRQLAGNLQRGYATAGSDAGHAAEAEDASWAYNHPEKIKDFGWRAVHLTAERAKVIVAAYYGKPAAKAYFDSCSDGGREALMEAQRFPEDYDGILAGAPANNWVHMVSSGIDVAQATIGDPRGYISSMKLPAIQRASLAACDALDGVKDGVIADPTQCRFDPQALLCKGDDSIECLTQPQVNSLKKYYRGGMDSRGNVIFPGYLPGDESAWGDWIVGNGPGSGSGVNYVQNDFRYMVTGDPKWNILTADVDASLQQAMAATASELDSTSPDLASFAARGGKLILYHGWNDPAISPWNSIAYYKSVQQKMGAEQAASFLRLYMVPGMEHCVGGPGANFFGQLGLPTASGSKFGIFDSLVDWVEKSAPPEAVVATKYAPDHKVAMTRPICAYPAVPKYKGAGDTNDAANFSCGNP